MPVFAPDDPHPPAEPEIWLHIGLHKTGTTHVQHRLRSLRAELAAAGLGTPDLGPHPGWPLVYWATETPRESRFGPDPARAALRRPEARAAVAERIDALVADPALPRIVLSGEQLSTQLLPEDVAALAARLRRAGRRPRALVTLREPAAWCAAMIQQRVLAGAPLADLLAKPPLPRFRQRLAPWLEALGPENVVVRVHDRARLVRGDSFADLLDAIGRPDLAATAPPAGPARNARLSAAGLRLLDRRNRLLGALLPGAERRRPALMRLIAEALPGAPLPLPPETLAHIRAATRKDLRWLEGATGVTLPAG